MTERPQPMLVLSAPCGLDLWIKIPTALGASDHHRALLFDFDLKMAAAAVASSSNVPSDFESIEIASKRLRVRIKNPMHESPKTTGTHWSDSGGEEAVTTRPLH
jgi:hypothetical protein